MRIAGACGRTCPRSLGPDHGPAKIRIYNPTEGAPAAPEPLNTPLALSLAERQRVHGPAGLRCPCGTPRAGRTAPRPPAGAPFREACALGKGASGLNIKQGTRRKAIWRGGRAPCVACWWPPLRSCCWRRRLAPRGAITASDPNPQPPARRGRADPALHMLQSLYATAFSMPTHPPPRSHPP